MTRNNGLTPLGQPTFVERPQHEHEKSTAGDAHYVPGRSALHFQRICIRGRSAVHSSGESETTFSNLGTTPEEFGHSKENDLVTSLNRVVSRIYPAGGWTPDLLKPRMPLT